MNSIIINNTIWETNAGMFATSDEEKDECRLKWRNFISNNNL